MSSSVRILPFESWDQVFAVAAELDPDSSSPRLVIAAAGTGLRPEELFALDWRDVDVDGRSLRVQRAFAKGRLKEYPKTTSSRRLVPLRRVVVDTLVPHRRKSGLVFPADRGGYVGIDNFRKREWQPAQVTAQIDPPRRIYDLRHTYATWSIAAGVNLFQLARRMGTSLQMIESTYGHLTRDAAGVGRAQLDAWDEPLKGAGG
jgi:integrase